MGAKKCCVSGEIEIPTPASIFSKNEIQLSPQFKNSGKCKIATNMLQVWFFSSLALLGSSGYPDPDEEEFELGVRFIKKCKMRALCFHMVDWTILAFVR